MRAAYLIFDVTSNIQIAHTMKTVLKQKFPIMCSWLIQAISRIDLGLENTGIIAVHGTQKFHHHRRFTTGQDENEVDRICKC